MIIGIRIYSCLSSILKRIHPSNICLRLHLLLTVSPVSIRVNIFFGLEVHTEVLFFFRIFSHAFHKLLTSCIRRYSVVDVIERNSYCNFSLKVFFLNIPFGFVFQYDINSLSDKDKFKLLSAKALDYVCSFDGMISKVKVLWCCFRLISIVPYRFVLMGFIFQLN